MIIETTSQELRVFHYLQVAEPTGYNPQQYNGAWPQGGAHVIKALVPPNIHSWRTPGNWHTVTVILAQGGNPDNHLMLGPLLQRIVSMYCDCMSGDRTNSTCSHCMAVVIGLFAPTHYRSTKVREPRLTDPLR